MQEQRIPQMVYEWTLAVLSKYALRVSHIDNRAVYTRENKLRLTLAAAYIRRERNHLYEYGLY